MGNLKIYFLCINDKLQRPHFIKIFACLFLSLISKGIAVEISLNENSAIVTEIQNDIAQTEIIIDNLAMVYDDLNGDESNIRSGYYKFDDGNFDHISFFDLNEQKDYIKILSKFVGWIQSQNPVQAQIEGLASLGRNFLMYNELLEAFEDAANEILSTSSHPELMNTLKLPSEVKARKYLKMVMNLLGDEEYISENEATRHGIKLSVRQMSGKCRNTVVRFIHF